MIAAIQMQWLGVAVAALIVAVLLLVVLIRHRGGDDRVMAAGKPAGPVGGATAPAEAAASPGWPPATPPDIAPSRAPQWAAPSAPVMPAPMAPAAAVAEAPSAKVPAAAVAEGSPAEAAKVSTATVAAERPPVTRASELTPIASPEQTGSFLDEPLTRGFEGLGRPAAAAAAAHASHGPFPVDPFGSHEDIFPPEKPAAEEATAEEHAAEEHAAEEPVAEVPAAETTAAPTAEAVKAPEAHAPVLQALTGEAPMAAVIAAEREPTLLSEIIVTTGDGEVDLSDPAVRGLLSQLVSDEIELAKACRDQAQTLDAILQLTEAEKICEALGLDEQLAEVRTLLSELQA
jgi:hypothetical protein